MKKRAMTLVEIIVAVLISSLLLGGAFQVFRLSQKKASKATTQQTLANEIRIAIRNFAQDIKAIRSKPDKPDGTQQDRIKIGSDGKTIEFDRYVATEAGDKEVNEQLAFNRFITVKYEFQKPFLTRTADSKVRTLTKNLEMIEFYQPDGPAEGDPGITFDEGWAARVDIKMIGSRKIPGSSSIASHTEQVSVFMLEEYYRLINKNRFLPMASLSQNDNINIVAEDFLLDVMLSDGELSPEELAKLTIEQLDNLMDKEQDGLVETTSKLDDINNVIEGVDSKGRVLLFIPWGNDTSDAQKDLLKHEKPEDIEKDIEELEKISTEYEKEFITKAFGGKDIGNPGSDELIKNKEAYDFAVRDRLARKAHESAKPEDEDKAKDYPGYVSMRDSLGASTFERGKEKNADGTVAREFTETEAEFKERREEANNFKERVGQVDIEWMDSGEYDKEMKEYDAAKSLRDLADTKLSYAMRYGAHKDNITKIGTAKEKL